VLESSIRPRLEALQDVQKIVGRKIKVVRGKKGVTQDQLAELAGLNRVHLYRIETGRQSMTLRTLKLIADALDVKMRDLIGNL
jgi:transcriptional regulator with XRE-family HTH domain